MASGRIEKQYQFERIQMTSFEGPRVALENSDLYLTFYFSFFFPNANLFSVESFNPYMAYTVQSEYCTLP